MSAVRLVAYSDYLCPWCYNASVRLHRLADEDGELTIEWRSYLLRPSAGRGRDLERFRAYTESWRRPAAEEDSGEFRTWTGDEGPPSHSIPAHLASKAAAELGEDAFRRFHDRLLRAYFAENSGHLEVTRAFIANCVSCTGSGLVAVRGMTGAQQKQECPLCHGTRHTRTIRAR